MSEVTHTFEVRTPIAGVCDATDGRFALGAVQVAPAAHPNTVSLRATDGHKLVACLETGSAEKPVLVQAKALKIGKKAINAELNGALRVSEQVGRGKPKSIKETPDATVNCGFPDIAQVFPLDLCEYRAVILSAEQLRGTLDALVPVGSNANAGSDDVTILLPGPGASFAAPVILQHADNLGLIVSKCPNQEDKIGDLHQRAADAYESAVKKHCFHNARQRPEAI